MKCVRCEIIRAKVWAKLMRNCGFTIFEIATELNTAYQGVYEYTQDGKVIRRPNAETREYVIILAT